MKETQVGTLEVDRHQVELFFDGSKIFYADVLGERLKAPSMDRLKDKVRERLRAGDLKLAIPATILEFDDEKGQSGVSFTDVELIGTHGGSGKVTYREIEGGRIDTYSDYYRQTLMDRLDDRQRTRLKGLRDRVHRAARAWEKALETLQLEENGKVVIAQEKQRLIAEKLAAKPDMVTAQDQP